MKVASPRPNYFVRSSPTATEELSNAARTGRLAPALHDYTHPHVLVIDEIGYLSLPA